MPKYYIGDILFCNCVEGSLMDLAIKSMQKEKREKTTKQVIDSIFSKLPTVIPVEKKFKDILRVVKELN